MIANQRIVEDMMMDTSRGTSASPLTRRIVNVYSDMSDTIREGDIITMTGELIGFDGMDVKLQWQFDNGTSWIDVPGANKLTHAFVATAETVNYSWRLSVNPND